MYKAHYFLGLVGCVDKPQKPQHAGGPPPFGLGGLLWQDKV